MSIWQWYPTDDYVVEGIPQVKYNFETYSSVVHWTISVGLWQTDKRVPKLSQSLR